MCRAGMPVCSKLTVAVLVGITLALLCIGVVAYPFFKTRSFQRADPSLPAPPGGVTDIDAIYEALQTLRLEYQIGKVPEELYHEQFRAYRLQAATALREQDEARTAQETLESEISAVGIAMYGNVDVSILCPGCGSAIDVVAGRCPECGTALVTSGGGSPGASDS